MPILFRQGMSDAFQQQFPNRRDTTTKDEAFRVEGKLKGNQSLCQVAAKPLNYLLCNSVTPSRSFKDDRSCETGMTRQHRCRSCGEGFQPVLCVAQQRTARRIGLKAATTATWAKVSVQFDGDVTQLRRATCCTAEQFAHQ